jgi:hypothetical protein
MIGQSKIGSNSQVTFITLFVFEICYTMAVRVLKQKYENSYHVVSICTKFTQFSHNGMSIMVLKCVITERYIVSI